MRNVIWVLVLVFVVGFGLGLVVGMNGWLPPLLVASPMAMSTSTPTVTAAPTVTVAPTRIPTARATEVPTPVSTEVQVPTKVSTTTPTPEPIKLSAWCGYCGFSDCRPHKCPSPSEYRFEGGYRYSPSQCASNDPFNCNRCLYPDDCGWKVNYFSYCVASCSGGGNGDGVCEEVTP